MKEVIKTEYGEDGFTEIYVDGSYRYTDQEFGVILNFDKSRRLHCDDGPATISRRGSEDWQFHGIRHRVGGPAQVICLVTSRINHWWVNGKRHREDGPAVEQIKEEIPSWCQQVDSIEDPISPQWWIDDVERSEAGFNYWRLQKKLNEELPEQSDDAKRVKI